MNEKLKKVLLAVCAFFGVWFIIPIVFSGIVNVGNLAGIAVFTVLFLCVWFNRKLTVLVKSVWLKKTGRLFLSVISILLCAIIVTASVETVLMVSAAVKNPEPSATVIVLGCRVYGERPSRMMVARLKAAKDFLDENPESACILSGGQGDDEDISEAECMYRWLVDAGISADRLYKEDKSTSTRENLLFSKEIIEREGLNKNIAIATNEFHEYRAQQIAKELSLESGAASGATEIWVFPTYYVRELCGILYEWIL